MELRFKHVSDSAVLVEFGPRFDETIKQQVRSLTQRIRQSSPRGLLDLVPAYVNILAVFDPLLTDHKQIERHIAGLVSSAKAMPVQGKQHLIPVCIDPQVAPDLAAFSDSCGLSQEQVIQQLCQAKLEVILYGFAPGYAYMDGVPKGLQQPRKTAAVRDVPAGSVIVAGNQCLITTLTMPTGWHRLGRTSAQVLTGELDKPIAFDIGDQLRFEPCSLEQLA